MVPPPKQVFCPLVIVPFGHVREKPFGHVREKRGIEGVRRIEGVLDPDGILPLSRYSAPAVRGIEGVRRTEGVSSIQ